MRATAKKPGTTIICAYNDAEKLEKFLLPSVRKQRGAEYELILLDNRQKKYPAAAPALNAAAGKARFDRLMFVHQDVSLSDPSWLADSCRWTAELAAFGAAGVAGGDERGTWANVRQGDPPRPVGEPTPLPRPVQTLDGCLLIVPTAVFMAAGFDEATLTGWHLFVLDYCLDLGRRGLTSYVLPQWVYHESPGPSDWSAYGPTLMRILAKHHGRIDTVHSTFGVWKTLA